MGVGGGGRLDGFGVRRRGWIGWSERGGLKSRGDRWVVGREGVGRGSALIMECGDGCWERRCGERYFRGWGCHRGCML